MPGGDRHRRGAARRWWATIRIAGTAAVPADELRPLVKINAGDPYFEPRAVEARDALVLEYLNRGFASVVRGRRPDARTTIARGSI